MIFRRKTIHISILIILISFFLSLNITAEDVNRQPRLNVDGITGDDFIGQAGLLYPFKNTEESLWFTDFRYRMSEDDVDEWNLGLGYRKKIDTAENTIAGIYAFKDRREEYDHYWDMWTIGGEILTDQWDFRLNGYITENDKILAPGSVAGGSTLKVRPEDQVLVYSSGNEVYYKSINGLDIELGKRFTETDTIFKNVGVYAKLFRFFESNTPTITGRQIRIDKQFGDRDQTTWKIGAQWRDDNVRGSETEATFAISIPFGEGEAGDLNKEKTEEEIVESRMTEQPERDLDVIVGESESENSSSKEEVEVNNPADGKDKIQVWYVSGRSDSGDGTKDFPYSIDEFINEKQGNTIEEGDIIVLSGKNGNIKLEDNTIIELSPYQQIISSYEDGQALVEAEVNGNLIQEKFVPDIPTANLVGEPSSNGMIVLSMSGGNNTISGIKFENNGDSSAAILGPAIGSTRINNNHIIYNPAEDTYLNQPRMVYIINALVESELTIENNEIYYNSNISLDEAGGIIVENTGDEKSINILKNTIDGFYSNNTETGSYDSAIYISDFSNDPIIKNNTIKNVNHGITNLNANDLYNSNFNSEISESEKKYLNNNNFEDMNNEDTEVIIEQVSSEY